MPELTRKQRHRAVTALQLLSQGGIVRVTDPRVREVVAELSRLGMLRDQPLGRDRTVPLTVPTIAAQRRLDALSLEGWSLASVADSIYVSRETLRSLRYRGRRMSRDIDRRLAEFYEEVKDERPVGNAKKVIAHAQRRGVKSRAHWETHDITAL